MLAASLALAACGSGANRREAARSCLAQSSQGGCRVLFIGNSYTYVNDLPSVFKALAASGRLRVAVARLAKAGETLPEHLSDPATTAALDSVSWATVVLQEQSEVSALTADREATMFPAARRLAAMIRQHGAVPVLFVTWAHRDGMNAPGLGSYASMQHAGRCRVLRARS